MEWFKKFGKTYWAKHLRNDGRWTKRMANSKSRSAMKKAIRKFLKPGNNSRSFFE
ncbi:MAG: hypothetical protein ACHQHN_15430 [Sphingobacteriales bacterium]